MTNFHNSEIELDAEVPKIILTFPAVSRHINFSSKE